MNSSKIKIALIAAVSVFLFVTVSAAGVLALAIAFGQRSPEPHKPHPDREKLGVSEVAYKGALKVESASRAKECRQLAGGCRRLAKEIDNDTLHPVNPVLSAMADEMGQLPKKQWKPFFSDATDIVKSLYRQGKLKEPADWSQLLMECSEGLDQAAREGGAEPK